MGILVNQLNSLPYGFDGSLNFVIGIVVFYMYIAHLAYVMFLAFLAVFMEKIFNAPSILIPPVIGTHCGSHLNVFYGVKLLIISDV